MINIIIGGVNCISYMITFFGWIPFAFNFTIPVIIILKYFCYSNGKHFFHVSNFRAGTQETGQRSSGGSPIGRSA